MEHSALGGRPGPVALVGSGEYLPAMADLEGGLLAGRPPVFVQLATAAVPDGPEVVERWHRLGAEQAARLGVEQVVLPVASRADADDPAIASLLDGAGLIYLSGGNPHFLAETLRDTLVWRSIVAAWQAGSALAGCSAGAMVMAARIPSWRHPRQGDETGLGLLPHVRTIPHFDTFFGRIPDRLARMLIPDDPALAVIGVDELTAIVGGPTSWTVRGAGSAWLLDAHERSELAAGTTFTVTAGPTVTRV